MDDRKLDDATEEGQAWRDACHAWGDCVIRTMLTTLATVVTVFLVFWGVGLALCLWVLRKITEED